MQNNLNFDEAKQSQLPLVEMLVNLGYRYVPIREVMVERRGDASKFILRDTAQRKLSEINNYEVDGTVTKFSDKDVLEVIDELENLPYEGLVDTSKKNFGMLMPKTGGKTIKVFHNGKNVSKSFKYIDFQHPENNDFAVTVEFEAMGKSNIRVDIAIFINGIPFVLIENKKSAESIELAVSQQIRNQDPVHCPKLFIFPQLLIGANKEDFRYGTIGTPFKFYAKWKERDTVDEEWKFREDFDKQVEAHVIAIIKTKIDPSLYKQILNDLNGATNGHTQGTDRLPTPQDFGVFGVLRKERLLDISKNFVLYDAGIKKVMRYQQYFAIKKMMMRVTQEEVHKNGTRRRGGILWQTQGSGKSLTMVMFIKALIEDPEIQNPRVIIVTDRKDLDRQIKGTFKNAGLKKDITQARSGEHLLNLIKRKDLRVVTTLIHKFQSAAKKRANFVDLDKNIFILIDEAHRSQHGLANIEMNRVIPNACFIAFTGTPLLRNEKSQLKFGTFIDRYTIDDALTDEIILPLIYEGRYVDLRQDKKEIDKKVDRLTLELKEPQVKYLQGIVKSKILQDNPERIKEIAYDVEKHFLKYFSGTGLKAQIVAPSKFAAITFQKYFQLNGKINSALVISDDNGLIPEGDDHKKVVDDYLKEIKANYQSLLSYEKEVIDNFKYNDDGVEILIVVDKLLTGFDAPRNTILYLAKELHDHGLLQAIARVNRLFESKPPKSAGYIIDYSENAMNLKDAMQLFGNYDEDDIKGTLINVQEKVEELEATYGELHDIFNGVAKDDEAYLQFLSDEAKRKEFYEALNAFLRVFSECTVLQEFASEFDHIDLYQLELKKFLNLKKTTAIRYADQVDFSKYERALIKIMDENIKAEEAELLTRQISINDKEVFEKALQELGSDKSRAEAVAAQTARTIQESLFKDPEFYHRFSLKIEKLLEAMRLKKIADIEALKEARLIEEQVINKEDESVPSQIKTEGGRILFRNLKPEFDQFSISEDLLTKIIFDVSNILNEKGVVDWELNPEQIRIMTNAIDDYLYDMVKTEMNIDLSTEARHKINSEVIDLAKNNHDLF